MSLFSKLKARWGYLPMDAEPALKDVDMNDTAAFPVDFKPVRTREYYSPSVEGCYLVISEDNVSTCGEQTSDKASLKSHEDGESAISRRLQRSNVAASLEEVEPTGVLHLPSGRKKDMEREEVRLECRTCVSDLPVRMKNASAVFFRDELCVGGGYTHSTTTDCIVYTYNSPFDLWGSMEVPAPCKWFAMVVFKEKLVLVGGKQVGGCKAVTDCWNKLTVWDANEWTHSLPPMATARVAPTAFTSGNCLVVAGGRKGRLDYNVEILDGDSLQWSMAAPLPLRCSPLTSQIHQDYWYMLGPETPRHLLFSGIQKALRPDASKGHPQQSSSWCELPLPPTAQPIRIVATADFLLVISHTSNNGNLPVHAYFPCSNSWTQVGKVPTVCGAATAVVTPQNELIFFGGDAGNYEYSNKVYKVTMATGGPARKRAHIVATAVEHR